jgi:hypothetical protein
VRIILARSTATLPIPTTPPSLMYLLTFLPSYLLNFSPSHLLTFLPSHPLTFLPFLPSHLLMYLLTFLSSFKGNFLPFFLLLLASHFAGYFRGKIPRYLSTSTGVRIILARSTATLPTPTTPTVSYVPSYLLIFLPSYLLTHLLTFSPTFLPSHPLTF